MKNSGCCGADEFLKLWAYTLTGIYNIDFQLIFNTYLNIYIYIYIYILYNHIDCRISSSSALGHGLNCVQKHG